MSNPETDRLLKRILTEAKTVAVVGMSDNPARDSFEVGEYLATHGYRVLAVNPRIEHVLDLPVFKNLQEIGEHVDVVDIFRRPEDVGPVVEDAIAIGAGVVWMQLGIVNEQAAQQARAAGLEVIMDQCMARSHRRLLRDAAVRGEAG